MPFEGIGISAVLTTLTVLAAVLGLLLLAAKLLGGRLLRRGGFQPIPARERKLVVRETIALDARRRLHLVRCGDREIVLLTGGPADLVIGFGPGDGAPR